jgi:hypothetical protein
VKHELVVELAVGVVAFQRWKRVSLASREGQDGGEDVLSKDLVSLVALPRAMSQRGDSWTKGVPTRTTRGPTTWRRVGRRHDQSEVMLAAMTP